MKKNSVLKILSNADVAISLICLVILIAVTFLGVIMRYVFGKPFVWQEEIQIWMIVWITFYGGGFAFRKKSHIAIDILVDTFPKGLQKVFEVLIYVVVLLVLGHFAINGFGMMMQYAHTGRLTNVLRVPNALIYSAPPFGCLIMIASATWDMYRSITCARREGETADDC